MAKHDRDGARVWWCALFLYLGFRILGGTWRYRRTDRKRGDSVVFELVGAPTP